jgi:hypothetical protein
MYKNNWLLALKYTVRVLVVQYCKTKPNSKSWLGICFKLGETFALVTFFSEALHKL